MTGQVFAVYDSKVRAYFQPYFSATIESGIREFRDDVNNSKGIISKHPEDFSLFHIGSFDNLLGTMIPLSPHSTLGKALDFLDKPPLELSVKP